MTCQPACSTILSALTLPTFPTQPQTYCASLARMVAFLEHHKLWHTLACVLTHASEHGVVLRYRGEAIHTASISPLKVRLLLEHALHDDVVVSYSPEEAQAQQEQYLQGCRGVQGQGAGMASSLLQDTGSRFQDWLGGGPSSAATTAAGRGPSGRWATLSSGLPTHLDEGWGAVGTAGSTLADGLGPWGGAGTQENTPTPTGRSGTHARRASLSAVVTAGATAALSRLQSMMSSRASLPFASSTSPPMAGAPSARRPATIGPCSCDADDCPHAHVVKPASTGDAATGGLLRPYPRSTTGCVTADGGLTGTAGTAEVRRDSSCTTARRSSLLFSLPWSFSGPALAPASDPALAAAAPTSAGTVAGVAMGPPSRTSTRSMLASNPDNALAMQPGAHMSSQGSSAAAGTTGGARGGQINASSLVGFVGLLDSNQELVDMFFGSKDEISVEDLQGGVGGGAEQLLGPQQLLLPRRGVGLGSPSPLSREAGRRASAVGLPQGVNTAAEGRECIMSSCHSIRSTSSVAGCSRAPFMLNSLRSAASSEKGVTGGGSVGGTPRASTPVPTDGPFASVFASGAGASSVGGFPSSSGFRPPMSGSNGHGNQPPMHMGSFNSSAAQVTGPGSSVSGVAPPSSGNVAGATPDHSAPLHTLSNGSLMMEGMSTGPAQAWHASHGNGHNGSNVHAHGAATPGAGGMLTPVPASPRGQYMAGGQVSEDGSMMPPPSPPGSRAMSYAGYAVLPQHVPAVHGPAAAAAAAAAGVHKQAPAAHLQNVDPDAWHHRMLLEQLILIAIVIAAILKVYI